jgi:histidine triad (HIT) family protein
MNEDCIFCGIANKMIPSDIVYEDDEMLAFKDVNPQSPLHLLFIPKKHIRSVNEVSHEDAEVIGRILLKIRDIAKEAGVSESGYRIVMNCNKDAGQEVFHLHLHLLGGRKFTWPPG